MFKNMCVFCRNIYNVMEESISFRRFVMNKVVIISLKIRKYMYLMMLLKLFFGL